MPIEFERCVADPELKALGIHSDEYRYDFCGAAEELQACINDEGELVDSETYYGLMRYLGERDLFFFLYFVLDMPVNDAFLVARIYEVQDEWDNCMDLWARGFWKSTIKSFALPLWLLIRNPEERIAIFSHTRNIAKDHMRRSKVAMENNVTLQRAWPDVFYANPSSAAPKWNEDVGLYVKRKRNYIEASIEAWGLVDNMPTGKHYTVMIFDDVIDLKQINTAAMITKATMCFRSALLLSARKFRKTINGTKYSHNDTYSDIERSKKFNIRIYPAEVDEAGKYQRGGKPVYLSREELDAKYDEIDSEYIWNCQMGQDARGEKYDRMMRSWLDNCYYEIDRVEIKKRIAAGQMYIYGIADPGKKQERRNDFTVFWIFGTDAQRNYWMLDCVRDKMTQEQKWERFKKMVEEWGVPVWSYEHVGLAADKEYLDRRMMEDGCFTTILATGTRNVPKAERMKNLPSEFRKGRIKLPRYGIVYEDVNGVRHNLITEFLEDEYDKYPRPTHDDMLDCMAQIWEPALQVAFPLPQGEPEEKSNVIKFDPLKLHRQQSSLGWMAQA